MSSEYRVPIYDIEWDTLIAPEHWRIYRCALDKLAQEQVPFALGGGLALGIYTGKGRHTKDLDLYILPEDRPRVVTFLSECGLADYYDIKSYVRDWIYRAHSGDVIVDAIWSMANKRADVDWGWLDGGPKIQMLDRKFNVIPPEELIWSKLYVLQRDRCDWPDVMNLLCATGALLDWHHLFRRVESDLPLLKGVVSVFAWVSPERAQELPGWLWEELGLVAPAAIPEPEGPLPRADLLDTRPWFCEAIAA